MVNQGSNLGVSIFEQLENKYVEIDEEPMEDIALTLLNLFTSLNNPAFNRAVIFIYNLTFEVFPSY